MKDFSKNCSIISVNWSDRIPSEVEMNLPAHKAEQNLPLPEGPIPFLEDPNFCEEFLY